MEKLEQQNKQVRMLPLTNDFVFKRVFTKDGNEELLKDFLSGILKINIEEIEIKNPEMTKDSQRAKQEILDIRAKINNNTLINIEMQVRDYKDIGKRSTTYTTKVHSDQLGVGDKYKEVLKTISIYILNFNHYNRDTYHSISKLKFEDINQDEYVPIGYQKEDKYSTEDIELHYIELPKFVQKNPNVETKLEQWLWLICGEGDNIKMMKKAYQEDLPSEEEVRGKIEQAKKANKHVKKAAKVLEEISQDEKEKMHYLSRLMWTMDQASELDYAREEGLEKGIEKGLKEGERRAKVQNAKKMLEKKISIRTIEEITGLTKEEILS